MIDAVPGYVIAIPNDGSGPSIGIGGSPDDPIIGQQEMIPGPPTIQYSHALSMPFAPHWVELASIPLYPITPGGDFLYGLAPLPVGGKGAAQDTKTPDPFNLDSLTGGDLGAPPLFTGNSNLYGRC